MAAHPNPDGPHRAQIWAEGRSHRRPAPPVVLPRSATPLHHEHTAVTMLPSAEAEPPPPELHRRHAEEPRLHLHSAGKD